MTLPAAPTLPGLEPPELDPAALEAALACIDTVRAAAAGNPEYGFDLPWPLFVRHMRMLAPQSYGARIQNRIAAAHRWVRVPTSADRGDIRAADGTYHEVKTSLLTRASMRAHFVQIRQHQDIAGYHCFVIDPDYAVTHLWLSKADMAAELARVGCSAHGTATALAGNATVEGAVRFDWDPRGGTTARWLERYRVPGPGPQL